LLYLAHHRSTRQLQYTPASFIVYHAKNHVHHPRECIIYDIHPLNKEQVTALVQWAGREGWNPGLNDHELIWNADPEGFLGLSVDGQWVAGGAVVRHNPSFGFMGLFIVEPKHRSQGLGRKLWYARRDHLLSRLQPDATIGLDAVDAMVGFYAQGGFEPFTRHRRFQWEPKLPPVNQLHSNDIHSNDIHSNDIHSNDLHSGLATSISIRPYQQSDFHSVHDMDTRCFPGERTQVLLPWIKQPNAYTLVATDRNQPDPLLGWGTIRPCLVGWKIGPLQAESLDVAESLIHALAKKSQATSIMIDVPDNNPSMTELCRNHQMQEIFGCVRMYLGPPPTLQTENLYAILSLEIG
jgi:GNAT superfamily N-acetyltransferase